VTGRDEMDTDLAQTCASFRGSVSREGGGSLNPTLGGGCGFASTGKGVSG